MIEELKHPRTLTEEERREAVNKMMVAHDGFAANWSETCLRQGMEAALTSLLEWLNRRPAAKEIVAPQVNREAVRMALFHIGELEGQFKTLGILDRPGIGGHIRKAKAALAALQQANITEEL